MSHSEAIVLTEEQKQILDTEVVALLALLPQEQRATFEALRDSIRLGSVSSGQMSAFERLLSWTLHTGRARREHSSMGESALLEIYWRTPLGKAIAREIAAVNDALRVLEGRKILGIHVSAPRGHSASVVVETEGLALSLSFEPPLIRVESISVAH